ncbi:MAG: helix-turn-helix transcriptional regulator [Polyangiales bacterium]
MSLSMAHELVGDLAELALLERDPAVLWPGLLQRLQESIPFDAGYIAASWGASTEGRGAVVEHDAEFLKRNLGRNLAEISPAEVASYTDRARNFRDVWSAQRRAELSVFNEILVPTGMREMLVRASVRNGNLAGFNLERRGLTRPFSEEELHLVDMVSPLLHIAEMLGAAPASDPVDERFAERYRLTSRELELVVFVTKGLHNSEIALLAGISPNTVRNFLVKIFEKVGVCNRAELTYVFTTAQGSPVRRVEKTEHPDDGTGRFAERVRAASKTPSASSMPPVRVSSSRIFYTPPLSMGD